MMKMAKEQEHTKTDTGSRKKKAKGVWQVWQRQICLI